MEPRKKKLTRLSMPAARYRLPAVVEAHMYSCAERLNAGACWKRQIELESFFDSPHSVLVERIDRQPLLALKGVNLAHVSRPSHSSSAS